MKNWLKKPLFKWLLLISIVAFTYGGNRLYKDLTMPPSLVFLIPDNYFGPVFFFFGQSDGVDVQPDPLGRAVWVPENGVVKLKAPVDEVMGTSSERHRAAYMISVSQRGERKILKISTGPRQDTDGSWWAGYFDENAKLHKFHFDKNTEERPTFFLFPQSTRDERMVFNHDGCRHQGFTPHIREVTEGKMTDEEAGTPACGKFLVVSPNEYLKLPNWMWRAAQRAYGSIQQFVDEANERVKKKKEYYNLLPIQEQESPASRVGSNTLRTKAGEPCPRTGIWQSRDTSAERRFYKEGEIMSNLASAYGLTIWQYVGKN